MHLSPDSLRIPIILRKMRRMKRSFHPHALYGRHFVLFINTMFMFYFNCYLNLMYYCLFNFPKYLFNLNFYVGVLYLIFIYYSFFKNYLGFIKKMLTQLLKNRAKID
jgi:hypothetical protein